MIFVLATVAIQPEIDRCMDTSLLGSLDKPPNSGSKVMILELSERNSSETNQSKLPFNFFCHQGDLCHLAFMSIHNYVSPLVKKTPQSVVFLPPMQPDLDGPFQPPKIQI
tara:strand:+ start:59409 stop:59738 length:330 start_codon:yes stop_codon:yes gene_type:complete